MAADLSALNNMGPADRSKLMQTVREQVAIQNFQQLYEKMVDKCFQKCVPKPSTDLDRYEKRCLEMCMDRYTDAWNVVSRAYNSRLTKDIELGVGLK